MPQNSAPDEFDFVIVGAGSAGCVLAHRLSEDPDCSVLLLEAGKRDSSRFIRMPPGVGRLLQTRTFNWYFDTEPEPHLEHRRLYWPRGKVLGGSSAINGMIYVRGHPTDYDHWAQLGNRGWSYEEVLPYFRRSMDQSRGTSEHHGVGGPLQVDDGHSTAALSRIFVDAGVELGYPHNVDFNGAEQEGFGTYQVTVRDGVRCSAAAAYLHPVLDRPNLTVATQALGDRVLLEKDRAVGVAFHHRKAMRRVRARREVILSAGAVQSPQLLMLSGIGPRDELARHGIEVRHELPGVGRNLQDHLDVCLHYHCSDPAMTRDRLAGPFRSAAILGRYLVFGTGLGTESPLTAGAFVRTREDLAVPDVQFHFLPVFMLDHGRRKGPGPGMTLHVCQLRPGSRGHVGLKSPRASDPPAIHAGYLSEPADLDVLVAGLRRGREVFGTRAMAPYVAGEYEASRGLESDDALAAYVRRSAETIYHPVGTCRMGRDEGAVVDDALRVHGVEGLRVVDASVMPTVVGGNTNAPTIMIAEKASDLIRGVNP